MQVARSPAPCRVAAAGNLLPWSFPTAFLPKSVLPNLGRPSARHTSVPALLSRPWVSPETPANCAGRPGCRRVFSQALSRNSAAAAVPVNSVTSRFPRGRGEKRYFPLAIGVMLQMLTRWELVCPAHPGSGPGEGGRGEPALPGCGAPVQQRNLDWSRWAEKPSGAEAFGTYSEPSAVIR